MRQRLDYEYSTCFTEKNIRILSEVTFIMSKSVRKLYLLIFLG